MPLRIGILAPIGWMIAALPALAQQFYSDRAAFLAQTQAGFYEEKFNGWSPGEPLDGHQEEWEGSGGNSFGLNVSAPGPGNNQLYSLSGAISTSSFSDTLVFQFSGTPVYAFGGDFWGTQYDGFPQATEIQFETENGLVTRSVTGPTFIGFVSNVPLTSVFISTSGPVAAWPTADNLVVGELKHDGDLDGDGATNHDEQLAGTDPGDPQSKFRVLSLGPEKGHFAVNFAAEAGRSYRLEYKDSLAEIAWQAGLGPDYLASASGSAQLVDSGPVPAGRFYRVTLLQP